jgi:hypothetical protein
MFSLYGFEDQDGFGAVEEQEELLPAKAARARDEV